MVGYFRCRVKQRNSIKQDQKSRDTSNIVNWSESVVAAVDFNQDTRKPHVAESRVFVDGEIFDVAQARVSNVGVKQGDASYSGRTPCPPARFLQPSIAWSRFWVVTRGTRRIVPSTASAPWNMVVAGIAIAACISSGGATTRVRGPAVARIVSTRTRTRWRTLRTVPTARS